MASHARAQPGISVRLGHLGGDFLARLRHYFEDVLKLEIPSKSTDWSALEDVAQLRHFIAHANGRLAYANEQAQRRLQRIVDASDGLTVIDGYLVMSVPNVRAAYSVVRTVVDDSISRMRAAFPNST